MTAMQLMNKGLKKTIVAVILFSLPLISVAQTPPDEIKLKTVCIDPGHGGRDPGAVGSFSYEKDIVLDIALKLGNYINENFPDVNVVYTRKTDKFVKLYERAKIANEAKADLFISIHINAAGSARAYGTETFAMGLHVSDANLSVAKKENAVILKEDNYEENYGDFNPNSPESHIMLSMFQNAYLDQSLTLAKLVQDQFRERVGRFDRGVKQAGFWVLYKVAMPSILIEGGFISNAEEEKFLNTEDGVTYMASAIYRAFKEYKKRYEADNLIEENVLNQALSEDGELDTDTGDTADSVSQPENSDPDVPTFPEDESAENIAFRVQIGTSSNAVEDLGKLYGELDNLWQYEHKGTYKHTAGKTSDYQRIIEIQKELKTNYEDCFIVAFENEKRISVREAIKALNQ